MSAIRCVCIESPLRGDYARNVSYADALMLDALERGEAPFLGHLLYPRMLNDEVPAERARGIAAHLAWMRRADVVVFGLDLGFTDGMQAAMNLVEAECIEVERRHLGRDWMQRHVERCATRGFR